MSYSASRLTIFALLSSIEEDLRSFIYERIGHIDADVGFGSVLSSGLLARYKTENETFPIVAKVDDLYHFLDFADAFGILNRHSQLFESEVRKDLKTVTPLLELLVPIRNRVAHGRPLHFDDLANTLDISVELAKQKNLSFRELQASLLRLEAEPSFVLGLSIPTEADSFKSAKHNLPLPDFDETGFVGRRKEVEDLKKLCLGAYPVISVVGEGGLGKTALALKVAYELLDDQKDAFDAIVWTTSKTTQLTATAIRQIQGAISTSVGVLENVALQLAGKIEIEDIAAEIHSYLGEFKILLILDNLENV